MAKWNASGDTSASAVGNVCRRRGKKCSQNGRPRPTWFSHSRDCDSWMPSEHATPSGVPKCSAGRPCSYIPWPVSCSTPKNASLKNRGLYRVVMRQSPGPNPEQNGCAVMSSRPAAKSNPMATAAALGEHLLPVDGELAFEHALVGLLRRRHDLLHERREFGGQVGEQRLQLRDGGARLVLLDQRVVRVPGEPDRVGLLPLELHDLVENRLEARVVVLLLGLFPHLLRLRGDAGQLLDERLRNLGGAVEGAAQLADVRRGVGFGVAHQFRRLDRREQFADLRVGELLVREAGEERHLLAAQRPTLGRHVRLVVPAQHPGAGVDDTQFLAAADQFGVRVGGGHSVCSYTNRAISGNVGVRSGRATAECSRWPGS